MRFTQRLTSRLGLTTNTHDQTMQCYWNKMKCLYPNCKAVLVGDEKCKKTEMGFDGRTYFTSVHPELGYLPLGPRKDTFTIMAKILAEAPLIPASSRHYVYNALFATSSAMPP